MSHTVAGAPLETASFTPCKDPVRKYCPHCFTNDNIIESRRQSTELVSDTVRSCVHSSDLGAVCGEDGMGRKGSARRQGFQPLSHGRAAEPPTEVGIQGKKASIPEKEAVE